MTLINFEIFEGNSSSRDAIVEFAGGRLTFPALREKMEEPRAKAEVDKMEKMGRKRSLILARSWCTPNGYGNRLRMVLK